MRTGRAAIHWAREQVDHPLKDWTRLCLQFVRMAFDLPAVYGNAGDAWDHAKRRHPTTDPNTIPRGVPVFWETSGAADHVALSLGGGLCLSTDVRRPGHVDIVRIDAIRQAWGCQLKGWTEDLNGVTIWHNKPAAPAAPPAPVATNVSRAREQLRLSRRALAIAQRYLGEAPDEREIAHDVGESLDKLIERITHKLDRLPKR